MPIFLMMVVGYVIKKIKFIDEHSTNVINKLVFKIFLPALLFMDLAKQDFISIWDGKFIIFCVVTTLISILISSLMALAIKNKKERGEFIQGSYRSAAATLGIAFMTNVYNNVGMVALMIIGSVPIYNIAAVMILSLTADDNNTNKIELVKKTFKSVITNPIIISVIVGLLWSVFRLPQPVIFVKSMTYLGNVASPLTLIALGATFEFKDVKDKLGMIIAINFNKLILFCVLFLPAAIYMGFRDEKIVALLIMLGSATTSSSFIMSKNMGHEGSISSSTVMTTTLFSSFTLTFWLFILKTFGYI